MAILHADNFSIYGTDTSFMTDGVYSEISGLDGTTVFLSPDPDGVSSGYTLHTKGGSFGARLALPSSVTTLGLAGRLYMPALPFVDGFVLGGYGPGYAFRDALNNVIMYLYVTTTGAIQVKLANGTLLGGTTGPVVAAGSWYHVEAKVSISATVGTVEVRVEGDTVISETSLNTGTSPIAQVSVGAKDYGSSVVMECYWKDFVVWDTSGTLNTDFLGSVFVTTLSPTGDTSLNWTPSTGTTGYQILDNIPPVDSQYISAADSPIPAAYQGSLSNLPSTVTSVKALLTYVRAGKSDGGDGSLQVSLVSDPSGTPATVDGADRPITTSQSYWKDVFEADPKTSTYWLPSAANDADIKINRTT